MVLPTSWIHEEPAPVPEGSTDNNHAAGLSPYQTCSNGTSDAESEKEKCNIIINPVCIKQNKTEDLIKQFWQNISSPKGQLENY